MWNEIGVISDEIVKALIELKFTTPTEIQKLAIPDATIKRCDILGAAETGSGKLKNYKRKIIFALPKKKKSF